MYHLINFDPKKTRALSAHVCGSDAMTANPGGSFTAVIANEEQLALRTLGELVELFNVLKDSDTPAVRKFKNKPAGAKRIFKLLEERAALRAPATTKKARRKPNVKKAPKLSQRMIVRMNLSAEKGISVEELAVRAGTTTSSVRTHLSDLKNVKYAGKEGPMDIYKVRGLFYVW